MGNSAGGTEWQGCGYVAATKTYRKWWPTSYPGQWRLPNGMLYPFMWHCLSVRLAEGTEDHFVEEWTWQWTPAPGMPSIEEVERMLAQRAAAATAIPDED